MKKKHITGLLVFVLALIAFDRGLFYLLRSAEHSSRGPAKADVKKIFFRKRDFNKQFLNLPQGTYNTLIMGSSRTHRGIHPLYIYKKLKQKAFKIAMAKTRIKFNYYFYQVYREYAGVPRVVIYGLDYFMFNLESHPFFLEAVIPANDRQDRAPARDGALLLWSNKDHIDSVTNRLLETWNNDLTDWLTNPPNKSFKVIDPFVGYKKTEPFEKIKPAGFEQFPYSPYPGLEGEFFTQLLDAWKHDGVRVILVHLPDYIGTYESNVQSNLFKAEIKRLSAPYANVHIYDFNRPDAFSLSNASYFVDGGYGKTNSHLSITGARVFNRKLIRKLRKHY